MVVAVALALAASPSAPGPFKLLGGSRSVVYPSFKVCERARRLLLQEHEKRLAEWSRLARSQKSKATRWVLDPVCLPL